MAITIRKSKKGYAIYKDGKLYREYERKSTAESIARGIRFERNYKKSLKRRSLRRNPLNR